MNRYGRQRLVAVGAAAVIGMLGAAHPVALQAADPPWDPPLCGDTVSAERARSAGSWFRVEPMIDGSGMLVGQQVRVGGADDARGRRVDLQPEAFATGPFAGAVLVGEDDGSESRLRLVDPHRGCATEVGSSRDVVRVAVVDPAGRAVYEHHVDRATRADLGVWRRPIDGRRPVRVLAGIRSDAAYGPTFGTELTWGSDGRLAVASCGERACRVRVVEPGGRAVRELGPTGAIVGLAGDVLVAYDVCPGLPCDIHAFGIRGGSRRTLAVDAGPAALAGIGGSRLAYEAAAGTLRSVEVATGRTLAESHVPAAAAPVRSTSGSGRGASVPEGWLLLDEPAGRYLAADPAALSARPIAEVSQ